MVSVSIQKETTGCSEKMPKPKGETDVQLVLLLRRRSVEISGAHRVVAKRRIPVKLNGYYSPKSAGKVEGQKLVREVEPKVGGGKRRRKQAAAGRESKTLSYIPPPHHVLPQYIHQNCSRCLSDIHGGAESLYNLLYPGTLRPRMA